LSADGGYRKYYRNSKPIDPPLQGRIQYDAEEEVLTTLLKFLNLDLKSAMKN